MSLRICFACDLHASESTYLKFINAAKLNVYKANVIIAGGDLTGKALVPIVKQEDGSYHAQFLNSQEKIKSPADMQSLTRRIRSVGYYYQIMTKQRHEYLTTHPSELASVMVGLMRENIERWVRIAEERLANTGVTCYMMPGNDDDPEVGNIIDHSSYVINPEDKIVELGEGIEMLSNGYSTPTPWRTPRECSEEDLKTKIEHSLVKMKNASTSIFNLHCPPYGTGLDNAPLLDDQLRPVVSTGEIVRVPVGSKTVLNAIRENQPIAGLHGHIHESPGSARIGKTMCFNPGTEYQSGILCAYLLDLEKNKLKQWLKVES
jgi:Icc-related predicted phosphoesterase